MLDEHRLDPLPVLELDEQLAAHVSNEIVHDP